MGQTFRPTVDEIVSVLKDKNYRVYDNSDIDWNLNIIGIRNTPVSPKTFDDTLAVFHRFMGEWDISYYPITTDPSRKYLLKPIRSEGTAILAPGQYVGVYKLDIHNRGRKSGHKALCQRLGDVTVYRDNTRDGELNLVNPHTGRFGINIHQGPMNGNYDSDNSIYSAGCQVFADRRHFSEFLLKCEHGEQAFGNSFTYTLLDRADFDA
ncbi:hypothetical protein [Hyphomonas sp.]|uniref:hypothetical protein n=1 Tax=Hyphomonas sp. TaxID=87 RepID=UPI0032421AD7